MQADDARSLKAIDEDAALKTILEGTATETGERFFAALVQNLAGALGTHGAWVTEYIEERRCLRALAFWMGGEWVPDYSIQIDGTPCEEVIKSRKLIHYPDNVFELYPGDPELKEIGIVSYLGAPLLDTDGGVLGHMAVIDRRRMPENPRLMALFRIFAARAAAELRRIRAEAEARERGEKLALLFDGAMDAVIELDDTLAVTRANPAAEKLLGHAAAKLTGDPLGTFLDASSRSKLDSLIAEIDSQPEGARYLWIPGGLALSAEGSSYAVEATLSRYEVRGRPFHALILRSTEERLAAERRIETLSARAKNLEDELRTIRSEGEILGDSPALRAALREAERVAATDATVLILGETGSGKELFARAIHGASARSEGPLVRVNCAAIPANLIESEFFGHERGAFTGATQRRDGRFTLADRGTIFLDEIGELPLDLQTKFLRVLQEGEFEPVGSSRTLRVDVRVIAATNRDLAKCVERGEFREDLYYRLNVFPIRIPPLRERARDIGPLAQAFADRFARRMGRRLRPLDENCLRLLRAYRWPGNIRELQNIIERAVIIAEGDCIILDGAFPTSISTEPLMAQSTASSDGSIRTIDELQELERENILRALETCGWKVAGANGAASRLRTKPSTLASRMKALGIQRPA